MADLEKAEGTLAKVEAPSGTEEIKPKPEKSQVPLRETEEFKKAQSGWDKQITLQKAEAQKAKAEVERLTKSHTKLEQELQNAQAEVEKYISENDPEALAGYKNSKALAERERKATEKEEALRLIEEAQRLVEAEQEGVKLAIILNDKANELQAKYEVPRKVLEELSTVEQMEIVAKAFPEKGATQTEKTPRFVSPVAFGSGSELSEKQRLERRYPTMKIK